MKRAATLLVLIVLPSCTLWDAIKPSSGISVDTEITAGDKNQQVATGAVVGTRETTTITAERVTYSPVTHHQGKTIWEMFLMMLVAFLVGWLAMPSSWQMWLMIKKRMA